MATSFHDAVVDVYQGDDTLPPLRFGVTPEDQWNPPYATMGEVTEDPLYDSSGLVRYLRAKTTISVIGFTSPEARAAAEAVRAVLTPDCLSISGKTSRLYQGQYRERSAAQRGPQGQYLVEAVIPLDAEIS